MPIDPAALRTEIQSGALAATLSPLVAAGRDADVAATINAKSFRGYVPIVEVAAYCCRTGVTGGVLSLLEVPLGGTIAPGVTMDLPTKGLLHTVLTLIQVDFRLTSVDVDESAFVAACGSLVSLGVMTADQVTAVRAMGDGRRSRAEVVFGDGVTVSQADVSRALRGA